MVKAWRLAELSSITCFTLALLAVFTGLSNLTPPLLLGAVVFTVENMRLYIEEGGQGFSIWMIPLILFSQSSSPG